MAEYVIANKQDLTNIAEVIRQVSGTTERIKGINNFSTMLLENIPSGQYLPYELNYTYTVDSVPNASYGFALNNNGYWESQNKGKQSSYALCRVNIVVVKECDLAFDVINYAELYSDYGLFGNLDVALSLSNSADSDVKKSYKMEHSADITTLIYENVPVGNHFIDVKFRKDDMGNKNNDSLQFKLHDGAKVDEEYYPILQGLDLDLTPEKILKGAEIFGVIGDVVDTGTTMSWGEIVPSETSRELTIPHNLNEIPVFWMLFIPGSYGGNVDTRSSTLQLIVIGLPPFGSIETSAIRGTTATSGYSVNGTKYYRTSSTYQSDNSFSYTASKDSIDIVLSEAYIPRFQSGYTYRWIAVYKKDVNYWGE